MTQESLRVPTLGVHADERELIRKFEDAEKKRMKMDILKQAQKHDAIFKKMKDENMSALAELVQLQV